MMARQSTARAFKYDVEMVFNEYYGALCLFATRFLTNRTDAEDIVQEVFVTFIEKPPVLQSTLHIQNHLYLSVRNACLSYIRRADARTRYLSSITDDQINVIEHEIIVAEVYRNLAASIDMLPTECRKVFELCYVQGLDNETVATMLNISPNTVKAQKARGKQILRTKLKHLFGIFTVLYGIDGMM